MKTITIGIKDQETYDKLKWFFEKLKNEIEIISAEDFEDLILLAKTRDEESIPFEEFLKNENKY